MNGAQQHDPEKQAGGPFGSSMDRIRQEFDQFLNSAFQQGGRVLEGFRTRSGATWMPPVDLIETTDRIECFMEVPGLVGDEVQVTLAGNMLTISGGGVESRDQGGAVVHLHECRHGRFERSIPMPSSVDAERVTADVTNGILHVVLHKPAQAVARQIPVRRSTDPASGI